MANADSVSLFGCQISRLAQYHLLGSAISSFPFTIPSLRKENQFHRGSSGILTAGLYSGVKTKYSRTSKLHLGPSLI